MRAGGSCKSISGPPTSRSDRSGGPLVAKLSKRRRVSKVEGSSIRWASSTIRSGRSPRRLDAASAARRRRTEPPRPVCGRAGASSSSARYSIRSATRHRGEGQVGRSAAKFAGQGSGQEGLAGPWGAKKESRPLAMIQSIPEPTAGCLAARQLHQFEQARRIAERARAKAEVVLVQRRASCSGCRVVSRFV